MSGHQTSSLSDEPEQENQQEQEVPSYEEKLATDLYKDHSSQNEFAKQIIAALALGGISYGSEVVSAYNLLKNPLDVEKLVNDPKYKQEVERAIKLVKRHEGRKITEGKSKYGDIVPRVELALARVEILHGQTGKVKKDMSHQYAIEIKQVYGLNDEQLKAIKERALERIKENPKLSMRDAVRMEARELLVKTVEKEVKDDKNVKAADRKKEIEKRLDAKDKTFLEHPQTATVYDVEKKLCDEITNKSITEINQTLGISSQQVAPSQPSPVPMPQPVTAPPPIAMPPAMPSVPVSMPGFSLPAGLTQGMGNAFSGLGKGLGSLFGKGGVLSKGLDFVNKAGKQLINRGIDALAPGLGAAIGKLNDAIKSIIGIDIEGTIIKGSIILVGAVASVVIILPIIMGIGVYSYVTGSNPVKLSSAHERFFSWDEFNKQYLSTGTNDNQLSWQQFSLENLTTDKKYLSLDPDRHDYVKK